jgi:hypothetical protein
MSKTKIDHFKKMCIERTGYELKNMTGKADMCNSLYKLMDLSPNEVSDEMEEVYRDFVWQYFMRNNKTTRRLFRRKDKSQKRLFDHFMFTDGYSASVAMTDKPVRCTKDFVPKKFKKKKFASIDEREDDDDIPLLDPSNVGELIHVLAGDAVLVACDPGKNAILTTVGGDGEHKRVLRYTRAQRDREIGVSKRRRRSEAILRNTLVSSSFPEAVRNEFEDGGSVITIIKVLKEYLRRFSACSCDLDTFAEYVKARMYVEVELGSLYARNIFRGMRFTSKIREHVSEKRFFDQLKATYARTPDTTIVPIVGNWGARPNLRNQAPSPGVGFHRRLKAAFPHTRKVGEWFTSSFCYHCEEPVEHWHNKWSLVKCSYAQCPHRWWQRDVLGALNIWKQACHLLRHAAYHPRFCFL